MSLPSLAPVVVAIVLFELAAGTLTVTWAGDLLGDVRRGFAGTTALICALLMTADLVVVALLPDPAQLIDRPVDGGGFSAFTHWAIAFTGGLMVYALFCAVGTDVARRTVGGATVACAGVALGRLASVFGSPLMGGWAGAVIVLPAALLAGSTLAGMLLGHWYLIAPDLSFRPLRRAVWLIFAAVSLQAASVALGLVSAGAGARSQVLGDPAFWLLVVATGLVATGAITALTYYFARLRANQPATAMLYVLIVTALMGLVPGHLLYFITQVPV